MFFLKIKNELMFFKIITKRSKMSVTPFSDALDEKDYVAISELLRKAMQDERKVAMMRLIFISRGKPENKKAFYKGLFETDISLQDAIDILNNIIVDNIEEKELLQYSIDGASENWKAALIVRVAELTR